MFRTGIRKSVVGALQAVALGLWLGLGLGMAGTAAAQEITLEVHYAQPSFAKFHQPIANEFMRLNPNIKIVFRAPATSYDEGIQTMLRQSIVNQLPDVHFSGYNVLAEVVRALDKRKQILDLTPLMAAEPKQWQDENYAPAVLDLGRVDGKLVGMAFNISSPIVYFNQDMVKKAGADPAKMPDTWDGMLKLAADIKKTSGVAGIGYTLGQPDDWWWRALVLQGGGQLTDEAGMKVLVDKGPGLNAVRYLKRMVTEAGMPMIDPDQLRQQFVAGEMGIFLDTPARVKQIADLAEGKFTLGTSNFPIDNKAKGQLPTGGNAGIITSSTPAKQKAAWAYLKFATGPEAQRIVVENTGYLPTNKLAAGPSYLGPFYKANPHFATVLRQMDRSTRWEGYAKGNTNKVWRAQRTVLERAMRGEITPEEAIDPLCRRNQRDHELTPFGPKRS